MKRSFITNSPVFHLLFPHTCIGCGSDAISADSFLCLQCIHDLPHTHFANHQNNPVEKIFWGRAPIKAAMAELYFAKSSVVQNLIHELKYRSNKEIGHYLGTLIGKSLKNSNRFHSIDAIIPLPLFEKKEKIRGYNQAEILCNGISEITGITVTNKNVIRKVHTETQTKKHRTERWKNVEQTFHVLNPESLEGKHILLVDDVITTGSTLDACAGEIFKINKVQVSIAALAMAIR
ncbi:MAG: phosphoribosyltransferase family protein [Ginsengibacter sp.]|jgi:ComF family protein